MPAQAEQAGGAQQCDEQMARRAAAGKHTQARVCMQAQTTQSLSRQAQGAMLGAGLGLVALRLFWGAALLSYEAQAASCAAGFETSASSRGWHNWVGLLSYYREVTSLGWQDLKLGFSTVRWQGMTPRSAKR